MSMEMIMLIANALLKYGPVVARELAILFQKKDVTLADWDKVFDLASKSYEDYVKPLPTPGSTTVTVTTEPTAPKTP